jgi:hypothetical protein
MYEHVGKYKQYYICASLGSTIYILIAPFDTMTHPESCALFVCVRERDFEIPSPSRRTKSQYTLNMFFSQSKLNYFQELDQIGRGLSWGTVIANTLPTHVVGTVEEAHGGGIEALGAAGICLNESHPAILTIKTTNSF